MKLYSALTLGLFSVTSTAYGACMALIKGPMILDVNSCGSLNPELTFQTPTEQTAFLHQLGPADRKKVLNSYRGLMIKAKVAKSDAVRDGLSPEKGILIGETISVFVPPGVASCPNILNRRIGISMEQACCEGQGEAPCLLSTTYTFKEWKMVGAIPKDVMQRKKAQGVKSPEYKQAEVLLKKSEFEKAAAILEKLFRANELDIVGLYNLGLAYRQQDQCPAAVKPLTVLYEKSLANTYWADEEPVIRRANFLLARCYSKMNNPDKAIVILNGFLIDPKKYNDELRTALNHKDFGWIKTSKEFKVFMDEARKKGFELGPALPQ